MLEDHVLSNILPSWQAAEAAETAQQNVRVLWQNATDAQRTAALAALQS
jgi:hypothetical protein